MAPDIMKFSERIGAVRRVLQKESMNEALKNALWNVLYQRLWIHYADKTSQKAAYTSEGQLLLRLWSNHFYLPLDDASTFLYNLLPKIKARYMTSDWASAYDFIEFIINELGPGERQSRLILEFNTALVEHMSAYRFVGVTLTPITSEEEITAVEQAMSHGDRFRPSVAHLETALARLSDRSSPDYRNSIKESISAVEAVCQIITNDPKATLGLALKKIGVHPALEKGFLSIYGYTSDADGIRHALSDEQTVDADDAKFFLVSCSAFVNYLIARSPSL